MNNTKALIIGMIVSAVIIVVGLVGYFEWRRAADAAAVQAVQDAERDQAIAASERKAYEDRLIEELAEALAQPTMAAYDARVLRAFNDLHFTASDRDFYPTGWKASAKATFRVKYPGREMAQPTTAPSK